MSLTHPQTFSVATHPGLKRGNNEDCSLCLPDAGVWVVADGMGGHEAGEVASAIVCKTIEQLSQQGASFNLIDAIQHSHQVILKAASNGIGALGMGSTIVAILSQKKHYQIAWVGDSRAYLWTPSENGGQMTRLTTDHSYVQMLYNSGAISADDIENHPDKNIITQCLGMDELGQVSVDITQGQWQKNQRILLCSDGLTDELSDSDIAQILQDNPAKDSAVDQLINGALTNGGRDNITIIIVESPVVEQKAMTTFWQWTPKITQHRLLDAMLFLTSVAVLLGLIFTTLK